jgi:23S rRNA G2069 N7-methylase RlmK/C1962 C5-methylase RlmI
VLADSRKHRKVCGSLPSNTRLLHCLCYVYGAAVNAGQLQASTRQQLLYLLL